MKTNNEKQLVGLKLDAGFNQVEFEPTVRFNFSDVIRWGSVTRYGNRNWFILAELAGGQFVQIVISHNEKYKKELNAHKSHGGRPSWGGMHDTGIRVGWAK